MLASVTLKRSLQQITNARTTAGVCRRSLSQAAAYLEPAPEASTNEAQSSNGIIRFTMTPKPQQQTTTHPEYATSNLDDPLFDRSAAAEQMSKQMEDSYYYASFQAK